MKKTAVFLAALSAGLLFGGEVIAPETFTSGSSKYFIPGGGESKMMVFVPSKPGSQTGYWKLFWKNSGKKDMLAEVLLGKKVKLPAFKNTLKIEMDIAVAKGGYLIAADMRFLDSKGEICCVNSDRGNRYEGNLHAVWTVKKNQQFRMAWGKNVNHKLDLPAEIDNIAFLFRGGKGNISIRNFKITAD